MVARSLAEAGIDSLVLLGCGKMGRAMLEGWLEGGLAPAHVQVIEPYPSDWLKARVARGVTLNPAELAPATIAVIAVKPQMMTQAAPRLAVLAGQGTVILSIAAGTPIATFEAMFGAGTAIIRAMPNTPAAVGRGIAALIGNAAVSEAQMTMAEALLAAVGQTVAWLSHSIKNILQGLRGGADAVELALNKGDLKLANEGWPILTRNLDRIYGLTLNMLAYSKQRELDIELAPLSRLVEEAAQLVGGLCDRKRVGLLLDLADDVPPIPLDPDAIHQALVNLLTNALEAAPPKTGVITVRTRYLPDRHEAQITVLDNGPGIPAERHDEVFEAFWSTKGQRGTGLGLAVTRKIIREHGGTVTLESDDGQGAAFTITLPSDRGKQESAETKLPQPRPTEGFDDEF